MNTTDVNLVVGNAVENRLHHHLEHDTRQMRSDGVRAWIEHFYLAHGVGTDSAEMPLIGTDFGEKFDEQLLMQPGMVVVFEPVIWEDGVAGYRSEDIVVVTDTGWVKLSGSTYDPYGLTA